MSQICARLHGLVQSLPEVAWPFTRDQLPRNGIYFFFEAGEACGHDALLPRIVRVGTHREGNFRSRMADHYVLSDRKIHFTASQPAPKDRSIFRKNIGRALLHRDKDRYEPVWELNFTTRNARDADAHRRDIEKETSIENEVTRILRAHFTFRCLPLDGETERMGPDGLEACLIGTLARCSECQPSEEWLGRYSPKPKIAGSGLWLEQHLAHSGLTQERLAAVESMIAIGR